MKKEELEHLKELAKFATSGDWYIVDRCYILSNVIPYEKDVVACYSEDDAEFIAAANPRTVVKLIERIEELEKTLAKHDTTEKPLEVDEERWPDINETIEESVRKLFEDKEEE